MRIPLNSSSIGPEEIEAAKAVLDSGFFTMGRKCAEFETAFAAYVGSKHALMVNSGSSANLIAAFALADRLLDETYGPPRIEVGAEVIVPALTWSTTVWPFVQAGAIPVFVDCDPATLQVAPEAIEAAITEKTRAIVVVHVLGGAVDVSAVREIADRHKLWLMEDTCESLGVRWDGLQVGTFGDVGTYSFYFAHHMTTIEGGMVVTNNDKLADLLRAVRSHGWIRNMRNPEKYIAANPQIDPRFHFVTAGFNVRPTEINGAIGLVQLAKLDQFNQRRREIGAALDRSLASLKEAGRLSLVRFSQRCDAAPFGYPVLCETTETRNALQAHLEGRGIETRPVICGNLARQPAMRHLEHRTPAPLLGADAVMDRGLYWGTHPLMTQSDVDYITAAVMDFFK
jgi:CDP-6-deoxy-D-xylo-4-hexulose-3-dehydrase